MSTKKRNFGLDLLRAISILLVLIAHKIQLPVELGLLGVQVFFILSGYLIGQILLADFEGANSFSTVLHFWKRRWFRTLPMYYLVLTLLIFFGNNPYGWKVIVYYFFLQANFIGIDFFPVSWSLVVEEWFYIFLPLASLVFFRRGIKPKAFLIFIFSWMCFFFMARFFWNFYEKGVIIYQFDCMLFGVLMASLKKYYRTLFESMASWPLTLLSLVGIVLLIKQMGGFGSHGVYDVYYRVIWYVLISMCIALLLPYFELSTFINKHISTIRPINWSFTWISVLSYTLYLLHPIFYEMKFDLPLPLQNSLIFILLFSSAAILFIFYERPVMNLRDDFSFRRYILSITTSK